MCRELNNTWLYGQGLCSKSAGFSETKCLVRRGNYFLPGESTSWSNKQDVRAAGGGAVETQGIGAELGISKLVDSSPGGTDTLDVGSNGNLSNYPVGLPNFKWDFGYSTLHALGLGQNSTYLNALLASNQIGARVWSMWWGRTWLTSTPMNGSIVLGGYDRKKVAGDNHTQALDFSATGCWTGMRVTITDIRLNFRDGTDRTLFKPNTVLQCCIAPQNQLLLAAPKAVFAEFEDATNSKSTFFSSGFHRSAMGFEKGAA